MTSRADILRAIAAERERQFNLPGSENDIRNTPNEWAAIAAHYLFEEVRRGQNKPDREAYIDALIKAAAVIVAALENVSSMTALGHLDGDVTGVQSFADVLAKIESSKPPHDLE